MTAAETLAEPVLRKIAGMPKSDGAALVTVPPKPLPVPVLLEKLEQLAPADDDIPAFLRRGQAAQQAADTVIAEQIKAEQAATKKRKAAGRIATMKAKKAGDTRKMPLTGRAALAAIRSAE
jgi:hypothetical protein